MGYCSVYAPLKLVSVKAHRHANLPYYLRSMAEWCFVFILYAKYRQPNLRMVHWICEKNCIYLLRSFVVKCRFRKIKNLYLLWNFIKKLKEMIDCMRRVYREYSHKKYTYGNNYTYALITTKRITIFKKLRKRVIFLRILRIRLYLRKFLER